MLAGQSSATRWTGHRIIDWAMQSCTRGRFLSVNSTVKLSDHKGLWLEVESSASVPRRGRLKPAPLWSKPSTVPSDEWLTRLAAQWHQLSQEDDDFSALQMALSQQSSPCSPDGVQTTWNLFMVVLNKMFVQALQALCSENSDAGQEARRLLAQNGRWHKGLPAEHQWVNLTLCKSGNPQLNERGRKLRRQLARAHEAVAQLSSHGAMDPGLARNLRRQGLPLHVPGLRQVIHDLHRQQKVLEDAEKQTALQKWRLAMRTGPFWALGQWVRRKLNPVQFAAVVHNGQEASTDGHIASLIAQHWQEVWSDHPSSMAQAVDTLVTDFGAVVPVQWLDPTKEHLHQAVRAAKGAAGPDHWSGEEVRALPHAAIDCWFEIITKQWLPSGHLPAQLKESRQVSLPKGNKIRNGRLQAKDTRPITVMSIFWRVLASFGCYLARMPRC